MRKINLNKRNRISKNSRKQTGKSFQRAARQKERLSQPVIHLDPATTKVDPVVRLSPGQAAAEELLDYRGPSPSKVRLKAWTSQWLESAERRQGQHKKNTRRASRRCKPCIGKRGRGTAATSNPKG